MAIFIDPYFQRLDKILNPKCSLLLQLSKNNIHIWPRLFFYYNTNVTLKNM